MFLLGVLQVSAQEIVCEKPNKFDNVCVKTAESDSLWKVIWSEGLMMCGVKDSERYRKECRMMQAAILNDRIRAVLEEMNMNFSLCCCFDREGRMVDIYFSGPKTLMEKLDKEDFRYMYNQGMKHKVDMENVVIKEDKHYIMRFIHIPLNKKFYQEEE